MTINCSKFLKFLILPVFIMFFIPTVIFAQDVGSICTSILEDSLQALADSCTGLEADRLCSGSGTVDLESNELNESLTNDDVALSSITSVSTSALDISSGVAGTALIRLKSDTNNQQAFMLLLGSAVIENQATGSTLPFYDLIFETDSSASDCDSIDAVVGIYAPGDTSLVLRINKAVFRVQGFITMQTINANSLLATVYSGELEIVDRGTITSSNSIAAITNLGEILTWSAPRPINETENRLGLIFNNILPVISGISPDVQSLTTTPQTDGSSATCENSPIHTVAAGENLYQIALQYEVTIDSIVVANELSNPQQIYPGQEFIIPCGEVVEAPPLPSAINQPSGTCGNGVVHTVEAGQTINMIAQGYGTTVNAISTANGIENVGLIHVGDQLLVPCNATQPPAPAPNNPTTPVQPSVSTEGFCTTFFTLVPPGGYPQPMIDLYNQNCT